MKRKALDRNPISLSFLLSPLEMLINWHYDRKTQKLVDRAHQAMRKARSELIHGTPA